MTNEGTLHDIWMTHRHGPNKAFSLSSLPRGTHDWVGRQKISPHHPVLLVVFSPKVALMLGGEALGASQSRGANQPLASLPFHYLQAECRMLMLELPHNLCISHSQSGS